MIIYKYMKLNYFGKYTTFSLIPSVYSNDYIVFDRMEIMMEEAIDSVRYLHID